MRGNLLAGDCNILHNHDTLYSITHTIEVELVTLVVTGNYPFEFEVLLYTQI